MPVMLPLAVIAGNLPERNKKSMQQGTAGKTKKIASVAIAIGIILYLSKFLRVYLAGNSAALFIVGFLPNFGLAFAIPFIYVSNRVRQKKQVKHFTISCIVTLLLMALNEVRDKYQAGRVFDMFDMYASFAGVVLAYFIFYTTVKKHLYNIKK